VTCTKTGSKNDPFLNCRRKPKELLKKELSNVAPASFLEQLNNIGFLLRVKILIQNYLNKIDFPNYKFAKNCFDSLQYHSYEEMTVFMNSVHSNFPEIARIYSIGKSKETGKNILAAELTRQKNNFSSLKPTVRFYVDNLERDQPLAREFTLHLMMHLVEHYQTDNLVR
jgi:hypothetical protein